MATSEAEPKYKPVLTTGVLIAFEGIDGSGKTFQIKELTNALTNEGFEVVNIDFPDYQGNEFGRMVGRYLNGEFGSLNEVDPYFASMLYAGDRLVNRSKIEEAIAARKVVICNRYVSSNIAYQLAKLPFLPKKDRMYTDNILSQEQHKFRHWLYRLEFVANKMPRPDLTILLDVEVETAQKRVAQKAGADRTYTKMSHDIHERAASYLERVAAIYRWLATYSDYSHVWEVIGADTAFNMGPLLDEDTPLDVPLDENKNPDVMVFGAEAIMLKIASVVSGLLSQMLYRPTQIQNTLDTKSPLSGID